MKVALLADVRQRLHSSVRAAGCLEIGGVLMAEQIAPGHFHIVDFTVDGRTGGAAHFVRSVDDHRAALTEFFSGTGSDFGRFNYLGEWHSHPNHPPVPSFEDITSMESLVCGERDIPFAVLLIVQAASATLASSATLFERGKRPVPVTMCDLPCNGEGE
ncbi:MULTISPECIES: Mov34/MPN/PAD-1 family protein [unclassified Sphingomonas]|uniref:Mov34/MPN/PAD-1 family protein n=1 Tax=unclassified Sphingomonas TaxID=196159 RepID=UPI0006FB97F5|nr:MULTISPECIES: Mov34/MPN/PAD-1 family protein [unclassified Sphingomonas]KQM26495.1 hypothetical protein ASE58_12305 [Sphingomonas sp. Leaf9]KQM42904.1 hypothetical protein ASE57_12310 [Sphingomonas sp. Leaf11]